MKKHTIAYRIYEENHDTLHQETLGYRYNLEEATKIKDEHNIYANAHAAWQRESLEYADKSPELKSMKQERDSLFKTLKEQDKKSSNRTELQEAVGILLYNISILSSKLVEQWKTMHPFKCNAPRRAGYCIIETITIG